MRQSKRSVRSIREKSWAYHAIDTVQRLGMLESYFAHWHRSVFASSADSQVEYNQIAEKNCIYMFANKSKKGVHTIKTLGDQIIAGFYSEEKGQSSDSAKQAVIAFAQYIQSIGY